MCQLHHNKNIISKIITYIIIDLLPSQSVASSRTSGRHRCSPSLAGRPKTLSHPVQLWVSSYKSSKHLTLATKYQTELDPGSRCHPECIRYVRQRKKKKKRLTRVELRTSDDEILENPRSTMFNMVLIYNLKNEIGTIYTYFLCTPKYRSRLTSSSQSGSNVY